MSIYMCIDLIITIFAYMIAPFIIFFRRKDSFGKRQTRKILIWNSIIVAIIFIAIRATISDENPVRTFLPPLFYYWINSLLWNNNKEDEPIDDGEKVKRKKSKKSSPQKKKEHWYDVK